MKTLEELQVEYNEAVEIKQKALGDFFIKSEELKEQTLKLAKYKVGQKASIKIEYGMRGDEIETGIIRNIITKNRYSDKLYIGYVVGKITKSGAMHKIQNVSYSAIEESNIIEVINE